MENQYFALTISKKNKADVGYYDSVLVPKFEDSLGDDYGYNSWYAGPEKWTDQIPEISGPLTLVMGKKYSTSVRSGSSYFYIITENFLDALTDLKHSFKQIIEVSCVNKKGQRFTDDRFYAAIPRKFFESECMIASPSKPCIQIKPEFDYDLFDIKEIPIGVATLICSDKARQVFGSHKIKGIEFVPLSSIQYPEPEEDNFLADYLNFHKKDWPV